LPRLKVLLDECIDRRLSRYLQDHDVTCVAERGWAGVKNGQLLTRAAAEVDCLVTVDQGLPFQHDLSRFDIAIVIIRAKSNRLQDLIPLIPDIDIALKGTQRGSITHIGRRPSD